MMVSSKPCLLLLMFGTVAVLSGCRGDSGGLSTEFEGDYIITSWTRNEVNCDSEGDSILERQNKRMLVQVCSESAFGGHGDDFLEAYPCADEVDCDKSRCTSVNIVVGGFLFRDGDDKTGWAADESQALSDSNGQCTGRHFHQTLIRVADGRLRIEVRGYEVLPFPKVEDCRDSFGEEQCFDICADEDSTKAAEGQPCTSLEVLGMELLSD